MDTDNLPEKMQAIQVVEYNAPYQINEVPVPRNLGPHHLLVKVAVASYCHTDTSRRLPGRGPYDCVS
jgi:alcohol dehydrogenase, propanol-preferring